MLQRRIVFGRRFQSDSNTGRLRNKDQPILLSTDAMTLVGGEVISRWRPLMWFWCSVAILIVLSGAVLAMLGPPSEPVVRERAMARPQADAAAAPKAAMVASRLPARRVAGTPAQPETAAAVDPAAPQSDQRPSGQAIPPLDTPAPASAGQQDAPARGRVFMVVHPARPEGGAAIADRLAARAGIAADQVDVGTTAGARSDAAIRFYSESDHAMARRIGRELAGMGYHWKLENRSQRSEGSNDAAIEVWLPNR